MEVSAAYAKEAATKLRSAHAGQFRTAKSTSIAELTTSSARHDSLSRWVRPGRDRATRRQVKYNVFIGQLSSTCVPWGDVNVCTSTEVIHRATGWA